MVPIMSLWLPIVVSAVFVFIASSLIHMFMKYHSKDFGKVENEDKVMDALRAFNIPPGEYLVPKADGMAEMRSAEFQDKMKKGPNVIMSIAPPGMPSMGKPLAQWFVYSLVIGVFAAYVTGRALGPGEPYLHVFRFAGFTAFACYAVAGWSDSIWFRRSWMRTFWNSVDGLIYGLLTAGVFGWLWPR